MSGVKNWLAEMEDFREPCPTDFKTKKECDAFFKTYTKRSQPKRDTESVWGGSVRTNQSDGEPFSINHLGDNAAAWLDDEPWRKW